MTFLLFVLLVANWIWASASIAKVRKRTQHLENQLFHLQGRPAPDFAPTGGRGAAPAAPPTPTVSPKPPPLPSPAMPAGASTVPAARYPVAPAYASTYAAATASDGAAPGRQVPNAPQRAREPSFVMPQGGTLFALAGGLFVLIGALTFLGMAISRGWISHAGQVALGVGAGAVLVAVGIVLARVREGSPIRVRNAAALITVGTGSGVITLTAVAGVVSYHVLPPVAGLLIVIAAAVASVVSALRYDSQLLAGFGVVTALVSPVLVDAPANSFTLGVLSIALIAVLAISVRRDWSWLALLALVVTAPQLAGWAGIAHLSGDGAVQLPTRSVAGLSVVLGGWWAVLIAAGFGLDLRRSDARPRASSASMVFLASSVAGSIFVLAEPDLPARQALWLAGFGIAHLVVAACVLGVASRRPASRFVALLLVSMGAAVLAWSIGIASHGPGRDAFWSVEALVLVGVHRRTRDVRALVAAVGAALLAIVDGAFHQVGLPRLFEHVASEASTITVIIALGAPCVAALAMRLLTHIDVAKGEDAMWSEGATGSWVASPELLLTAADVIALATGTMLVGVLAFDAVGGAGRTCIVALAAGIALLSSLRRPASFVRLAVAAALMCAALIDLMFTAAPPSALAYGLAHPAAAAADLLMLAIVAVVVGLLAERGIPSAGAALLHGSGSGSGSSASSSSDEGPGVDALELGVVLRPFAAMLAFYLVSVELVTLLIGSGAGHAELVTSASRAQFGLSSLWALVALAGIVVGLARGLDLVHKSGAALLTVVGLKVLLIDTQQFGSVGRVGAFVGVGLVMLVGGFVYLRAAAIDIREHP